MRAGPAGSLTGLAAMAGCTPFREFPLGGYRLQWDYACLSFGDSGDHDYDAADDLELKEAEIEGIEATPLSGRSEADYEGGKWGVE